MSDGGINGSNAGAGGGSSSSTIHLSEAAATALSCPSERGLRVPCYCEENVWRLAYRRLHHKPSTNTKDEEIHSDGQGATEQRAGMDYHVVFVSNNEKCCPMFCQIVNDDPNEPCLWDYHVLLIGCSTDNSIVIDMDSHLPFPCPIATYLSNTFRVECINEKYREKLAPRFRVIKAELYLQHFYSDRLHMFDTKTGQWQEPPPQYECIMSGSKGEAIQDGGRGRRSNLDDYINMQDATERGRNSRHNDTDGNETHMGRVYTLDEFRDRFCGSC